MWPLIGWIAGIILGIVCFWFGIGALAGAGYRKNDILVWILVILGIILITGGPILTITSIVMTIKTAIAM